MKRGFTLIELSIVLVIIGLIVAGIMVGQTMIENARVRAQVTQIEQLITSVNVFRGKYAALPGDITPAQATNFGMASRAGTLGRGDGNTTIGGYNSRFSYEWLSGETKLFWNDLSVAKLIERDYSLNIDDNVGFASGQAAMYLPQAKISNGNYISVLSTIGEPDTGFPNLCRTSFCFFLGRIDQATMVSARYFGTYGAGLTPAQAYSIDTKMDDGRPLTGKIQSSRTYGWVGVYFPDTIYGCTDKDGVFDVNSYATTATYINTVGCIMNIAYK